MCHTASSSSSDGDLDGMFDDEPASSGEEEDDRRMGMSAFAPADEWEDRIQEDIETEGGRPSSHMYPGMF